MSRHLLKTGHTNSTLVSMEIGCGRKESVTNLQNEILNIDITAILILLLYTSFRQDALCDILRIK